MAFGKKELKKYIPYIILLSAVGTSHLLPFVSLGVRQGIYSVIYISVTILWYFSLRRRFINRNIRGLLSAVAILALFLLITRNIRYEYTLVGTTIIRLLWYSYYIPFILIPVLIFLTVLHIGKAENDSISPLWYLLFIPAGAEIAVVETNDLHRLMFVFTDIENEKYTYGLFYYIVIGVIIAMFAAVLGAFVFAGRQKRFSQTIWLPLCILLFGLAYIVLYSQRTILRRMYELPEMAVLVMIGFTESLILTRMLPSNTGHEEFFRISSISAGLADNDLVVQLRSSDGGSVPSPDELRLALRSPLLTGNGASMLKCSEVSGGYFYSKVDMTGINRLNAALEDTGDYLAEEQAMLEQSVRIEENRKRTVEKNILYDNIAVSLRPQFEQLSEVLSALPEEEGAFRAQMKRAAFLSAFVKRKSNLLLIEDISEVTDSGELAVSAAESLEYLRLSGIECMSDIPSGIPMKTALVLYLYELLESAAEESFDDINAVIVMLRADETALKYSIELGLSDEIPDISPVSVPAASGGTLTTETSGGCRHITFTLPKGGEAV